LTFRLMESRPAHSLLNSSTTWSFLDLNLPRLDGVAILKHVRAKKPSLPILILTARGRVDDRVYCLDSGADDYLVKPFSFSELSRCCGRAVCRLIPCSP
jgi:DNA-binding response OmpR family regulator